MSTVAEKPSQLTDAPPLPRVPRGFELVDGVLVERNVSIESSWIGGEIYRRIANHSIAGGLGWAFPPETGCQCFENSPTTLRKPDTLFVKAGRMGWDQVGDGWLHVVPDLIVEVISPNDKAYDVEAKVEMFLKAGVPLIWVVNPKVRTVRIIRGDGSTAILREANDLSGEDIIPGFTCPVGSIFPPRTPAVPAEVVPRV
jgi:Uma2 family endonuclease